MGDHGSLTILHGEDILKNPVGQKRNFEENYTEEQMKLRWTYKFYTCRRMMGVLLQIGMKTI